MHIIHSITSTGHSLDSCNNKSSRPNLPISNGVVKYFTVYMCDSEFYVQNIMHHIHIVYTCIANILHHRKKWSWLRADQECIRSQRQLLNFSFGRDLHNMQNISQYTMELEEYCKLKTVSRIGWCTKLKLIFGLTLPKPDTESDSTHNYLQHAFNYKCPQMLRYITEDIICTKLDHYRSGTDWFIVNNNIYASLKPLAKKLISHIVYNLCSGKQNTSCLTEHFKANRLYKFGLKTV